ncbi:hypothetical protein MtrunA17_Chr1g0175821 [Medicago truncatula]|uniref:Uncharacterized protein n=1 Tax=Medicago truncatula TaxID=3880 RepID=A0A396JLY5_MEDTR|nr:hypothetical protein MtrunA17_Chr1g0175821 [Medicago truncatula]
MGRMDSKSVKDLPERPSYRKRKAGYVGKSLQETSSATPAKTGDGTSIWDDNFPFGDFVDKHFNMKTDYSAFEAWELENCAQVMLENSVQSVVFVRCMGKKVCDLEKKNKAYVEENTELRNKLSESEKNVDKLEKNLEELSLEKSRSMVKEEDLAEENSKMKIKLLIKEDMIDKLKGVIEDLKAEIEEVKAEIPVQYNAGFDKAVKQILVSISELKH